MLLWPSVEFDDHCMTTRPYEVAFLQKYKNLVALLKLMIKEIKGTMNPLELFIEKRQFFSQNSQ